MKHYVYMMNSMRTCITVFPRRYFEQKNALNYAASLQENNLSEV